MNAVWDCPYCGRPHESLYSVSQHAHQTEADDHDTDDLDEAILQAVAYNDGVSMIEADSAPTSTESAAETTRDAETDDHPGGSDTTSEAPTDDHPGGAEGTVTDGGERFPTPDADDGATTSDDHGDDGTEPCPACRAPLPVDGIEPGTYTCSNCGQPIEVTV